jgi:hypothetical protein
MRYTLLAEGSTDEVLLPLLDWTLRHQGALRFDGEFARPKDKGLVERIKNALEYYPCDLLFVHRDADSRQADPRYEEIHKALAELDRPTPAVCVVPIQTTEAWLMFDEAKIRQAVGNRNGRVPLNLPNLSELENESDPKARLREILITASGKSGRRRDGFKSQIPAVLRRIADPSNDFSPLLRLSAFQRLQTDVRAILDANGWREP